MSHLALCLISQFALNEPAYLVFTVTEQMMSEPKINQNWTIFNSIYEALMEEERKKLRLAKCTKCGRATPYRLKSPEITAIRCKKCGTYIPVRARLGANDPMV